MNVWLQFSDLIVTLGCNCKLKKKNMGMFLQVREGIFGKKYRMEFASLWNKAVDQTFEPAIQYLSSRKW